MVRKSARRGLAVVGVLLLGLGALAAQNAALGRRAQFPAGEDVLYLPRPPALKALLLGHGELAADLVFIRALIYFGSQFHEKGEFRWLENYLDTITVLDPRWKTPFVWAGVATMYNGKTIDNRAVALSSRFLERGARQFPDDWQLPFMLACNYLFELKSDDAQEKEEWRRIGSEWLRHAADVGGTPPWVPLLSATIMRQEGRDEAALHHLEQVYLSTQDERARQEIRNELGALHTRLDLAREGRERRAFELAWRRTMPYAPPDLFVAVGPPRPPRMDWQALSPLAPAADVATDSVAPPATDSVAH
jgi:hypothetical protein